MQNTKYDTPAGDECFKFIVIQEVRTGLFFSIYI